MRVFASVLFVIGLVFIGLAVLGILRLPDFYTRLHAMGKCDTLGVTLVLLALAMYAGLSWTSAKLLLIAVCTALANPLATHALGRAAYKSGLAPWTAPEERSP